jgi:hypothetical protein
MTQQSTDDPDPNIPAEVEYLVNPLTMDGHKKKDPLYTTHAAIT